MKSMVYESKLNEESLNSFVARIRVGDIIRTFCYESGNATNEDSYLITSKSKNGSLRGLATKRIGIVDIDLIRIVFWRIEILARSVKIDFFREFQKLGLEAQRGRYMEMLKRDMDDRFERLTKDIPRL